MFCPKCGKELKQDDFNVCPYCGYDLHLPVQQNDNDNDGNDENLIRFGWLKAIGILIGSIIAFLIVINVVTSVMNYISIRNQTSTVTPTTSTSSSVSISKQKKSRNNYEGYVNENSYVCTDYDTLIELDDALRHGDKEHMKSLFLSGRVFAIKTKTKAEIIDTGLLDKNAVSVIIEEGKHASKDGYTFKDWTSSR